MSTIVEGKMDKLIDKMSEGREDQLQEVVAMRKTLKTALLKRNIKGHPALQMLLGVLTKREQGFSLILQNKEDLTPDDRNKYFARRKEVRFILSFFDVDKTINGLEAIIDYQLSDDVSPTDSGDAE